MKTVAIVLAAYIMLILLQPAYMNVADLFCSNCNAAATCAKQHGSSCPKSGCCEKKPVPCSKQTNNSLPRLHATCEICNPFLLCSHSGFVFTSLFVQQSLLPSEKKLSLSANEKLSFTFAHEFWHPPESC